MSEKHYIKGAIKKANTQFGEIINLSVSIDDLASCETSDKGYIRLSLMQRKEPDEYGNTHYLVENTYKGDGGKKSQESQKVKKEDEISVEDIPF